MREVKNCEVLYKSVRKTKWVRTFILFMSVYSPIHEVYVLHIVQTVVCMYVCKLRFEEGGGWLSVVAPEADIDCFCHFN